MAVDKVPVAPVWTCPGPCPFCGAASGVQQRGPMAERYRVTCYSCGASGPNGVDRPQAIRLWNMRDGKA